MIESYTAKTHKNEHIVMIVEHDNWTIIFRKTLDKKWIPTSQTFFAIFPGTFSDADESDANFCKFEDAAENIPTK